MHDIYIGNSALQFIPFRNIPAIIKKYILEKLYLLQRKEKEYG
jgi:hypothetical protein